MENLDGSGIRLPLLAQQRQAWASPKKAKCHPHKQSGTARKETTLKAMTTRPHLGPFHLIMEQAGENDSTGKAVKAAASLPHYPTPLAENFTFPDSTDMV